MMKLKREDRVKVLEYKFIFEEEIQVEKEYKLKKPLHKSKSEVLKLSLITSCYNAEKFLDELADSIIGHNFDNWEWVIGDDFSDDNTFQKLLDLQNRDPRIRVAYPKHKKQMWWNPQKFATGILYVILMLMINCYQIVLKK